MLVLLLLLLGAANAYAPCPGGSHETWTAGVRGCAPHTVCKSTQWEATAPGTHHDRVCGDCGSAKACAADGMYFHACGGTSPGRISEFGWPGVSDIHTLNGYRQPPGRRPHVVC